MTDAQRRQANAEAQSRSRRGVKAELKAIRCELQDLREALAAKMAIKSLSQENDYGD